MREQSNKYELVRFLYDETNEDSFHGFLPKLNHLLQLSVRSALIFGNCDIFHSETHEKIFKTEKNKQQRPKRLEKVVVKVRRQKTAVKTRWLSAGLVARLKLQEPSFCSSTKIKNTSPQSSLFELQR